LVSDDLPQLRKVYYFSNGANSKYYNCKTFFNLCHHEEDFHVAAKWNFFATSQGKSPCDGTGGTVKRLVVRASLQATERNHILTPDVLYKWAKVNITGIALLYITKKEIKAHIPRPTDRLQYAETLPGAWSHHKFVPIKNSELKIYLLSSYEEAMGTKVSVTGLTDVAVQTSQLRPGKYVADAYNDWYIGCIIAHNDEECDILVKFMERKG
jgi:hypothetical protein